MAHHGKIKNSAFLQILDFIISNLKSLWNNFKLIKKNISHETMPHFLDLTFVKNEQNNCELWESGAIDQIWKSFLQHLKIV